MRNREKEICWKETGNTEAKSLGLMGEQFSQRQAGRCSNHILVCKSMFWKMYEYIVGVKILSMHVERKIESVDSKWKKLLTVSG